MVFFLLYDHFSLIIVLLVLPLSRGAYQWYSWRRPFYILPFTIPSNLMASAITFMSSAPRVLAFHIQSVGKLFHFTFNISDIHLHPSISTLSKFCLQCPSSDKRQQYLSLTQFIWKKIYICRKLLPHAWHQTWYRSWNKL